MTDVVVLNSLAIPGNAGKYMSTAKGVTTLRAPSRRMRNTLSPRERGI
jgi:hypothetical protein